MSLRISADLSLPPDAVTQTFGILAKRGAGKTYTGSVMVEEMLKANLHVIVVDPIGVWWGLRASADGKHEGLKIVIAGGEHADVPITPDSGEALADLVVENKMSIVIDVSLFRKGEQTRFMTAFAETLYRRNRSAVHLVLDEADAFAPQRPFGDEARLLGAIEDIVRRGRARGIGVTMITQRPAVLNKNVLTQIEVLVVLRLTSPQDRAAIGEWVKMNADPDQAAELLGSLQSLPIGTAWFYSPGWLDLFQKVPVRKRETLDSSSTPKAGQTVVEARKLAPVDLDVIREKLAASIERVESEDPKVLRKQIADLQRQLSSKKPQVEVREVVREVIPDEARVCVGMVLDDYKMMGEHIELMRRHVPQLFNEGDRVELKNFGPAVDGNYKVTGVDPAKPGGDVQVGLAADGTEIRPSKAARALLGVLAAFPGGRTKVQLSILSGYSIKSSSFSNALGELRSAGMITPAGADPIGITDVGREFAGPVDPPPTGDALRDYWYGKLGKSDRAILAVLLEAYPASLDYEDISERSGYSRQSSSFSNALGKLRSLQLVVGTGSDTRASDVFYGEGSA